MMTAIIMMVLAAPPQAPTVLAQAPVLLKDRARGYECPCGPNCQCSDCGCGPNKARWWANRALPVRRAADNVAWKRGPLPPNTWQWGGVVPVGLKGGFFFADFCGDHVKMESTEPLSDGSGHRYVVKVLKPDEVAWYNNSLDLPPGAFLSTRRAAYVPVARPVWYAPPPVFYPPPRPVTMVPMQAMPVRGAMFGGGC